MTDTQPNKALIDSVTDLFYGEYRPGNRKALAAFILGLVDEAYPERAAAPALLVACEYYAHEHRVRSGDADWVSMGDAARAALAVLALARRPSTP